MSGTGTGKKEGNELKEIPNMLLATRTNNSANPGVRTARIVFFFVSFTVPGKASGRFSQVFPFLPV